MNYVRVALVMTGCLLGFGLGGTAHASPLLELGVAAWNAQATGEGASTQGGSANSTVDLQNDLGMQRKWTGSIHLTLRHGLPVLPDLMVESSHVFNDGSAVINRNITWQGRTFQANGLVQSQVDLHMDRLVAFWNPLDNTVANLRLGLEARRLSLDIPITGDVTQPGGGTQKESVSAGGNAWLPLGYAGLTLHLPAGVDLDGDWSYVSYSGNYLSDYRLQASYNFDSGFFAAVGWRLFHARLDSSHVAVKGDLEFKGIYTAFGYAF